MTRDELIARLEIGELRAEIDRLRAELARTQEALRGLREAVDAVYYAAHWTPDRKCDAARLWTKLRDAAGLTPGETAKRLGPPRNTALKEIDRLSLVIESAVRNSDPSQHSAVVAALCSTRSALEGPDHEQ